MFRNLWQRLRGSRSAREREKDGAAIEQALRDQERGHPDPGLREAGEGPPIFKNNDWAGFGGGP